MEHTRKATTQGWRTLTVVLFIAAPMIVVPWIIDLDSGFRWMTTAVVGLVAAISICSAIADLRSTGAFSCRLTDTDFIQEIPVKSSGDSFTIKLDAITAIEHNNDSGSDWIIHTVLGRFPISNNYGNPAKKFARAIQKRFPHLKIAYT